MHLKVRFLLCVMDLLCLCVQVGPYGAREAGTVHFKEVIGVWHSGLKWLCLCVNLTWQAGAMHFEV